MIQKGKNLFTKLTVALCSMAMLIGGMAAGAVSHGIAAVAQASAVDDLNMNDQQKAKIEAIFRQANEQIKELKANAHISRSPFAAKQRQQQIQELAKEIKTTRTEALQNVRNQLNPTQQAAFDQYTAKMKEPGEKRMKLLKSLDLSQQQRRTIAQATEQSTVHVWDVLGDSTLSNEQKSTKVKKIKQDSVQAIREQLTAEQQAKFDAWRQQQQKNINS